jgi:hypothetical protein
MDKVIEQLKELNTINPREDWVQMNKELLLSQIKAQSPVKQSSVFSYWYLIKLLVPFRVLNFVAKPVGVLTMVAFLVISSGVYSVNASRGSVPGDILYPVKLTTEKVKVGLTSSSNKKTELKIGNAEERVNEIDKIILNESDTQKKKEKIEVAADNLKKDIDGVKIALEKVKEEKQADKAQESIAVVMKVDEKTAEISSRLIQHKEVLNNLEETQTSNKEVVKRIDDAMVAVKETGVKATEVIVDKYDKGESNLAPQEVKDSLSKKIVEAQEKLKEVTEKEKTTQDAITQDALDNPVKISESEDLPVNSTPTVETNTETDPTVTATDSEVAPLTNDVPVEVEAPITTQNAEKVLAEAQVLLEQGDLVNALEKLKTVNSITKEVELNVEDRIVELQNKIQLQIDNAEPIENPVEEVAPVTSTTTKPTPTAETRN